MAKNNPLMQGLSQLSPKASPVETLVSQSPATAYRPPARTRTKLIGGHFAEEVSVQLKVIAAENKTTLQDLMAEAINGIFAKYQRPQIATLKGQR